MLGRNTLPVEAGKMSGESAVHGVVRESARHDASSVKTRLVVCIIGLGVRNIRVVGGIGVLIYVLGSRSISVGIGIKCTWRNGVSSFQWSDNLQ
jgi:hypothetical protein